LSLPLGSTCSEIASALAPLARETVSDEMDMALNVLKEQLPLTIKKYPTGMNCFDWILPEKWSCRRATLQRLNGEKILSYEENPLVVRSYSLSYEGKVSRSELIEHITVHPTISTAVPYEQALLERDWGFCCSARTRDGLADDQYKVEIATDYSYGELKVGEMMVPGETSETVLICTYLDHPCQMNISLSGVLAGIAFIRACMNNKRSRFTFCLLFLPGSPGLAAWLTQNRNLVPRIVGGVSLRMLARPYLHILQRSVSGDTMLDNVCESVIKERDPESQIVSAPEVFNEFPSGGNPIYNGRESWGNIPMISLARALPKDDKNFPYRSHLTDLDTFENADLTAVIDTVSILSEIFDVLESTG
jgi:aminopeptidase-like protein